MKLVLTVRSRVGFVCFCQDLDFFMENKSLLPKGSLLLVTFHELLEVVHKSLIKNR